MTEQANSSAKRKKWYQAVVGSRFSDILFLVILVIIGYRGWFRPGMLDYGDLWYIPREVLSDSFSFPCAWFPYYYLGASALPMSTYPLFWFTGLFASLGFSPGVCQRIMFFFPYLIFSIFSIYYFTYTLFKKRTICFFATLLFVFNTSILGLVTGGILFAAIAQALCPLVLAFFIKGLQQKRIQNGVLAGIFLSLSIASFATAAYLTIGAIFLFFIDAIIKPTKSTAGPLRQRIVQLTAYLAFVFAITVVLHFYWILPALLTKTTPTVMAGHESVGWAYALSYAKLSHTISMFSCFWPPTSIGVQPPRIEYFVIPLLVLIGIIAGIKDRNVRLLAIIALLSVFFAKGTNKPFGEVYAWFFKYFPGGSMFRTPGKFDCMIALSYAPLLGIGVNYLAENFKKIELNKLAKPFKGNLLKGAFLVFIFCYLIYLVFPAMSGKLGGTFKAKQIPKEYQEIEQFVKSQPDYFRTYWRPHRGRYAFYSKEHPVFCGYQYSGSTSDGSRYFASEAYNPKAFIEMNCIAKILGILNVKYCFLPQEKEYLFQGKDFYLKTLENQSGLKKINIGKNIEVFENQFFAPRFFATKHGALIVGGLKALFLLSSLEGMDLSRWAIFFAEQSRTESRQLFNDIEAVVFYNSSLDDLVMAFLDDAYRINLTKYVIKRSDDSAIGKWVRGKLPPEQSSDGTITHSLNGIIYRHTNVGQAAPSKLNEPVPIEIKDGEDYEIWIRPFKGKNRGKLNVSTSKNKDMDEQASHILIEIDLNDENDSFQWVKIGTYYLDEGTHYFQIIHHSGPIGMVDQFVVVPKKIKDGLHKDISKSLEKKKIVLIKEPNTLPVDIFIPQEGNYRIAMDISNTNFSGVLSININGSLIKKENINNSFKDFWLETDPVKLEQGASSITISEDINGKAKIKKIIIYKDYISSDIRELFKVSDKDSPVTWQEVNPAKYRLRLKTEKPTFLIFSEGFDKNWRLNLKKPVSSVCAYGIINSFFIPKANDIEAILEFTPQRYVYTGLWVSAIGFILICFYLLWQAIKWTRRR